VDDLPEIEMDTSPEDHPISEISLLFGPQEPYTMVDEQEYIQQVLHEIHNKTSILLEA
jgi:hypothetical protein